MRAHYLQHVPFEGLGSIESWLGNNGFSITSTRFFDTPVLPHIEDIDLLIVMGGPMSVNDEKEYPWLVTEKAFIRDTIESGKPVLGICLGAQLIAAAMGAEVYPNPEKEIGWFPIERVSADNGETFVFPDETVVFHWHGETFSLPEGAVQLARSTACENQAFQLGNNVIGLQFHLETTPDSAQAIVQSCRAELIDKRCIQSEREILSVPNTYYRSINALMTDILDYVLFHTK